METTIKALPQINEPDIIQFVFIILSNKIILYIHTIDINNELHVFHLHEINIQLK